MWCQRNVLSTFGAIWSALRIKGVTPHGSLLHMQHGLHQLHDSPDIHSQTSPMVVAFLACWIFIHVPANRKGSKITDLPHTASVGPRKPRAGWVQSICEVAATDDALVLLLLHIGASADELQTAFMTAMHGNDY